MDSKCFREAPFKFLHHAPCRAFHRQIAQRARKQIVHARLRMLRLENPLNQLAKVRGRLQRSIIASQTFMRFDHASFTQNMQVSPAAARNGEIANAEHIRLAGQRAFEASDAFCHGLEFAILAGEPGQDQAGIAKAHLAQHNPKHDPGASSRLQQETRRLFDEFLDPHKKRNCFAPVHKAMIVTQS